MVLAATCSVEPPPSACPTLCVSCCALVFRWAEPRNTSLSLRVTGLDMQTYVRTYVRMYMLLYIRMYGVMDGLHTYVPHMEQCILSIKCNKCTGSLLRGRMWGAKLVSSSCTYIYTLSVCQATTGHIEVVGYIRTLAMLSPDNSVKGFTIAFYVDAEHDRADVWLCTHRRVAASWCGIAHTTRVSFKKGTVPSYSLTEGPVRN